MGEFKSNKTLNERSNLFSRLQSMYPDAIPIVIQRKNKYDPELTKYKYLVPKTITLSYVYGKIMSNIKLHNPNDTLIFFVKGKILNMSDLIEIVHDKYKDEDGFLYLTYTTESTFG